MNQTFIIMGREFNERVRKKSFILTTLLMPLFVIALMVAPTLIMLFARGEARSVVVVDDSRTVAPRLQSDDEVTFVTVPFTLDMAREQYTDIFGILHIGPDIVENPSDVQFYINGTPAAAVERNIEQQIKSAVEALRLEAYDIYDLESILASVEASVTLDVYRNDPAEEGEQVRSSSSIAAAGIGFVLGMILYMFLIIYGAMVMQSIIEEKSARILEMMISTVRPFELMLGKIAGIACVAAVQIMIWGVLVVGACATVMPSLGMAAAPAASVSVLAGDVGTDGVADGITDNVTDGVADGVTDDVTDGVADGVADGKSPEAVAAALRGAAASAAQDAVTDPEIMRIVTAFTDTGYMASIFVWLLLFAVGGYLLYSALFAAIGASVDSAQDAQQLQLIVMMPIIVSIMVMVTVINDPSSGIAVWCSYIPFTSPVVMMARIPSGVPLWQILVSLGILCVTFTVMVWLAARIYRVGILVHGKKPSLREILRWIRY